MGVFLYLFVLGFLGVAGQDNLPTNCPYKECVCGGTYIFCDNLSLRSIPERRFQTNTFYDILDLDTNQITTIPAGRLLPNLTAISLQENPIETIDEAAFDESIYTLQTLTITGAKFTQLPAAVCRLQRLQNLNIYDVKLLTWDDDDMKNLSATLKTFHLVDDGLTSWPSWLKSFTHLTDLGITSSGISSLPDDALDMLAGTLQKLDLSNNSLTSVPKAISKLTALTVLSLEENKITDFTWLPQLSNLTELTLTENRVSDARKLSAALRVYSDTLHTFTIYDNFLTSMPDLSFLTKIKSLDYSNNHISDPYSGSIPEDLNELRLQKNYLTSIPRVMKTMKYVPSLDVSYNRILSIQGTDFPISVTGADLGNNVIQELTDTSFPPNSNITFLLLPYNPISKISLLAFQNLPQLQQLDLRHTKLTRMPLSIALLTMLTYIDVSGSTDLVCTCLEKSLESRITTMVSYTVVGDCGQTSLYFFFKELSPDCPVI